MRRERRAASFSSELCRHPMVVCPVVITGTAAPHREGRGGAAGKKPGGGEEGGEERRSEDGQEGRRGGGGEERERRKRAVRTDRGASTPPGVDGGGEMSARTER